MHIAVSLLTALTLTNGVPCFAEAQPLLSLMAAAPTSPFTGPVTAAERTRVVEGLADVLQGQYLDPQTGTRYATLIRAHLAQGIYDSLVDPIEFGERLTADLQSVVADNHLRLAPEGAFRGHRDPPADAPAGPHTIGLRGMEEARMIGDVAFLRFNEFPDQPTVADNARDFLLAHSDAEAVIIDVRSNRGGGLAVMAAILPLLYATKTTLVRMDLRASAPDVIGPESGGILVRQASPETLVRYDHVVLPDASEAKLQHVPVYYLTSRRTASAAEHLAFAFKRTHRAILIGESTAGANHFGIVERFGRFAAFIPVGRTYDPDTGWDWEGKGVSPDIAVPPEDALNEALTLAKQAGAHRAVRPKMRHRLDRKARVRTRHAPEAMPDERSEYIGSDTLRRTVTAAIRPSGTT